MASERTADMKTVAQQEPGRRTCAHCAEPLPTSARPRKYCSLSCWSRAQPRKTRDPADRFAEKWALHHDSGCHLWAGAIDTQGYASFRLDGRTVRGHVFAYTRTHGPVPRGLFVLHHECDIRHPGIVGRRCVNPDHLRTGTVAENAADMVAHGRGSRATAKLTDEQVRAIRARRAAGDSCCKLAREYGVHHIAISRVARRRSYRHVV